MTQPITLIGVLGLLVLAGFIATLFIGCSGPSRLSPEQDVSPAQEQCRAAGKNEDCR